MATDSLPFYFSEALQPIGEQTARELERKFTQADRQWFAKVFLPDQSARQAQTPPMTVEKLLLNGINPVPVDLAGAFLMASGSAQRTILYTPALGLEHFDSRATMSQRLKVRLQSPNQREELLRFLPLKQRTALGNWDNLSISTSAIHGSVFQDRKHGIENNQSLNLQDLLKEFESLPSFSALPNRSLLDTSQPWATKEAAATSLLSDLKTQLKAFWRTPTANGLSRQALVASTLGELFRAQLQQQLVSANLGACEYQQLSALYPQAISVEASLQRIEVTLPNTPPLAVAQAFVMGQGDTSAMFLCRTTSGLQKYDSQAALERAITQQLGTLFSECDLPATEALGQYAASSQPTPLHITFLPISDPLFGDRTKAIIGTQTSNLDYVLKRYVKAQGQLDIEAAIHCALDIWSMIDPRLDIRGIWNVRLDPSSNTATATVSRPTLEDFSSEKNHLQTLRRHATEIDRYLSQRLNPHTYIQTALSNALSSSHARSPAPAIIFINRYASPLTAQNISAPTSSLNLIEHFLTSFPGSGLPLSDMSTTGLFEKLAGGLFRSIPNLTVTALNSLMESSHAPSARNFLEHCRAAFQGMDELLCNALSAGLRHEARLKAQDDRFSAQHWGMIQSLLDTPQRIARNALNGFLPDAFALTLSFPGLSSVAKLAHCFLITERGGVHPAHSGKALLWTPAHGLEPFDSLTRLTTELDKRLLKPADAQALLENLDATQHAHYHEQCSQENSAPARWGFDLIANDFLKDRRQSFVDKCLADIAQAASSTLPTGALKNLVLSCLSASSSLPYLSQALEAMQNHVLLQSLPNWLHKATPQTQHSYAVLLDQHRQRTAEDPDYLHTIPTLAQFAKTRLCAILALDFPSEPLDPDAIELTLNFPGASHSVRQTLTELALSHCDEIAQASVQAIHAGPKALPGGLNAVYLKALVTNARIGPNYCVELQRFLTPGSDNSAERQELFSRQLLWQSLEHAFEQSQQEHLTPRAHAIIKHVLEMSDGIAREPLDGQNIIIRPIELSTTGDTSARALGLYLIGPEQAHQGPQILYAPYSERYVFREYTNEGAFIERLCRSTELQKQILERLPEPARTTYEQIHFPSTNPGLQLNNTAIAGNLFSQLFNDTTALFRHLLKAQFSQYAAHAWNLVKEQFKDGLYLAPQVLLGRLRLPLTLWQTLPKFKEAADNAWTGHWGRAMEEFVMALAQVALAGKSTTAVASAEASVSQATAQELEETVPAAELPSATPFPQTDWGSIVLTAQQKARLLSYEIHDVALNDLTPDRNLGVYLDFATNQHYAPIAGKVFQVAQQDDKWRIVKGNEVGPWLKKNAQQQWALDLRGRLQGGGLRDRLKFPQSPRKIAQHAISIEATGMKEIRALYPEKAQMIRQAHELAVFYLKNGLINLQKLELSSRFNLKRQNLIKQFFNISEINTRLTGKIDTLILDTLKELLDPSLSPDTSARYVVGSARQAEEFTRAFTVNDDKKRRLFLSELFFDPLLDNYKPLRPRTFNLNTHSMAATLIHEISHMTSDTMDIAYLDSFRPFYDLVDQTTQSGRDMQPTLQTLQATMLSPLTPRERLFQEWNPFNQQWSNLRGGPLKRVLELTNTSHLDDARDIFFADEEKRINVILANADSVTYLISHLGRPDEFQPLPSAELP